MLTDILLLALSLLVLTGGAELLVRGAVAIAKRLGVSAFFIGLTIVGFGTSTPELSTSLMAALKGSGDIAVGNVVGSNICNLLLILGATALIRPIAIELRLVRYELLFVLLVSLLPFVALATDHTVTRWQGLAMVALLIVYLWRGYLTGRREESLRQAELEAELEREVGLDPAKPVNPVIAAQSIAAGLALLIAGSWLLVRSASGIARSFGVSELVIGLTVVALGTSAPELFTSVVAAVRKQSDIAVGNILGSNIFNLLGILGITAAVRPQTIDRQVFRLDAPLMLATTILLAFFMRSGSRLSQPEGACMLLCYAAYTAYLLLHA
ncbi:MAG: sodium:calcium antiporter [Planctomycetota bacterium]|nr:MAG: sodium:calcium antiporter [Planctomycetota bacterium]